MTKKEVFELELLAKGFFDAVVDMYRTAETEAQKHQLIDILFVYRTWLPAELFESKIDEKMLSLGIVPVSNDSFFISALAITASFDYNKLNYNLLNEVTLCI